MSAVTRRRPQTNCHFQDSERARATKLAPLERTSSPSSLARSRRRCPRRRKISTPQNIGWETFDWARSTYDQRAPIESCRWSKSVVPLIVWFRFLSLYSFLTFVPSIPGLFQVPSKSVVPLFVSFGLYFSRCTHSSLSFFTFVPACSLPSRCPPHPTGLNRGPSR